MRILITGQDKFEYNRTRILIKGLEALPDVKLVYYPVKEKNSFNVKLFSELTETVDIVYLPPFRHSDVKFIKKHSKAPIVFDALISKYLTRTIDHGKWWTAIEKTWRDKVAFKYCDVLVMDTENHRRYVINKYNLPENKVIALPVGVDTEIFKSEKEEICQKLKSQFVIGFYGGMIPLQGVDKIIEAARFLQSDESIVFKLIGKGPRYKQIQGLIKKYALTNVELLGWVSYEELNDHIDAFDLCLGIFGDSLKTDIVIPNKVFHYSALGKCILSKDTPGIKEIYQHSNDIILLENKPELIAAKILELKKDESFRKQIGVNALLKVATEYNHIQIARSFINQVSEKIGVPKFA